MSFLSETILTTLSKPFNIKGRASRIEYWTFFLLITPIFIPLYAYKPKHFLYLLLILSPFGIPLSIRRLHDINKSGFWLFLNFIPLLGPLFLFYWSCLASDPNENSYGMPPKGTYNSNSDTQEYIKELKKNAHKPMFGDKK